MTLLSPPFPRLRVAPRRHDGSPKFSYPVSALELSEKRWVLHGVFGPEVGPHSERLGFYPGDHTIEFYVVGDWANVYAVFSPDGQARGFYCNIGTPPEREGDSVIYTDLDIDLLVRADGSHMVLDEDEYQERADRFGYTAETRARVAATLRELVGRAERRAAPFDGVEARAFFEHARGGASDQAGAI